MGLDPISLGMMAFSGFKAYSSYKGGKEAQEQYNTFADEEYRQGQFEQRQTLEEMQDLNVEGRTAEGEAIAQGPGRGLAAGGSSVTQVERIRNQVARKKSMMSMGVAESMRRHAFTADRYRSAGRSAKTAGGINAFGSLLVGGGQIGERRYEKGWWPFKVKA